MTQKQKELLQELNYIENIDHISSEDFETESYEDKWETTGLRNFSNVLAPKPIRTIFDTHFDYLNSIEANYAAIVTNIYEDLLRQYQKMKSTVDLTELSVEEVINLSSQEQASYLENWIKEESIKNEVNITQKEHNDILDLTEKRFNQLRKNTCIEHLYQDRPIKIKNVKRHMKKLHKSFKNINKTKAFKIWGISYLEEQVESKFGGNK